MEGFVAYTDNSEPPQLFKKWVAVGVVAAVLRRKCFLNWGYMTFFPNMYIVLCGPSGCRKGTAMGPGYDMLRELGIKMSAESITREALIRELKNSGDSFVDAKNGKITPHCSLTVFSQELTVFLGYNNHALMADLADWYDCRSSWTYRTKNMGTDDITNIWVNLMGATTPELVQTTLPLDAIGGGLTSRIIFVYEEKKGKSCPTPFLTQQEVQLRQILVNDLEQISMIGGEFRITKEFLHTWIEWYHWQEAHPPFKDSRFAGYIERRPTHMLKLSIIMSAMRKDSNNIITEQDFNSARALMEETEVKMPRTLGGMGKSANADVTTKVLAILASQKQVKRSELLQTFYHDADKDTMNKVLATLESMKAIEIRSVKGDAMIYYTYKQQSLNTDGTPISSVQKTNEEKGD
jgi:hypothetical protein